MLGMMSHCGRRRERFFFDKLRLYVWSFPNVVNADIVANSLVTMSDEAFWEFYQSS